MLNNAFVAVENGSFIPLDKIPVLEFGVFRYALEEKILRSDCRISACLVRPVQEQPKRYLLTVILLSPEMKKLLLTSCAVAESYESLTKSIEAFHWFEREIYEEYGIKPEGHPFLKPIRFSAKEATIGVTDYFTMQGEAVHEVAVGPVHAGVIEPGHFRFQCMGEDVFSLEIELGYQHRGIEKMLCNGPGTLTQHLVETAAGDSSIAASTNYWRILESLKGIKISPRTQQLRLLALELERIANHTGDLGALAGDVAFLPTASFCGRIRGDFLNMTAMLCGNRFGRNFLQEGTVAFDLTDEQIAELAKRLETGEKELFHALDLMMDKPSVLDRFENTGTVTTAQAKAIGLVGVAAKASGLQTDVRKDLENDSSFTPVCDGNGDVLARAKVRVAELRYSIAKAKEILANLPRGGIRPEQDPGATTLPGNMLGVSVTEAWRGELCHVFVTGEDGRFQLGKIVDSSFHNWFGLALALRDQQISDFPICNKSFNLSYCGHDL